MKVRTRRTKNRQRLELAELIRRPIQRWFWLFLLPTFAAFCVGFLYPFLKGLFLSFCKFKTTSKWTWVGLNNYVDDLPGRELPARVLAIRRCLRSCRCSSSTSWPSRLPMR